jgi:hypothetical protein
MLDLRHGKTQRSFKKLSHRWKGPYKIIEVIDNANYKVNQVKGKNTVTVNKRRLKRSNERKVLKEMHNYTIESSYDQQDTVEEENCRSG